LSVTEQPLRAVLDTNVIVAALKSKNPHSPTRELLERWENDEFELLYAADLRVEYAEKLAAKRVERSKAAVFLDRLARLGTLIPLRKADLVSRVPADPDDDVVLACAIVGQATHLVTYDPHLHALGEEYQGVRILDGLHFLYALRGDVPPPILTESAQ
jgi:putative PIN family toxin of toxin-antitoxin system